MKKDSENREVITYNTGVINRDEPRNPYEESYTVIQYKEIVTEKEKELRELLRHTQGLETKTPFTKWMYRKDEDEGYYEYYDNIPAAHKECYKKLKEMERKNIKKKGGKRSRKSKKRSRKSKKRTRKNKKSKRKST